MIPNAGIVAHETDNTRVMEANNGCILLAKRILYMNKIPIILITGMWAPKALGLWFVNCEQSTTCTDFIDKHDKVKLISFVLLAVQIYFVFRNIKKLVKKVNNHQP